MVVEFQYEQVNDKHISAASELLNSAYDEERKAVPFLPKREDFNDNIQDLITKLFKVGNGIVAMVNGELVGFIAGFEIKELFGRSNGVYCPLYGHGTKKEYGNTLYQELYKQAAEMWVRNNLMTHVITVYAHDKETIDTWFWQGFGLRCVDAIRKAEKIQINNSDIVIKKASILDIPVLADIHRQHNLYYKHSPIFMPREEEDPIRDLTEWIEEDNRHLWIAYHEGKPLGYMRIQPNAESFISEHKNIMNITGAYVINDERKAGIGAMILNEVQNWLIQNRYTLCGVDFESINIIGSNFWSKYFTPYTYSMVRRIDERVNVLSKGEI